MKTKVMMASFDTVDSVERSKDHIEGRGSVTSVELLENRAGGASSWESSIAGPNILMSFVGWIIFNNFVIERNWKKAIPIGKLINNFLTNDAREKLVYLLLSLK